MKFRPLIGTDLSGSIGGITASRNRGGAYFRNRAIPVNPSTPAQQVVRGAFAAASSLFLNILTEPQKGGWDDYAANTPLVDAIGQEVEVTGRAMFIRSNVPLIQAGLGFILDAPEGTGVGAMTPPSINTVAAGSDQVALTFDTTDPWANENGGYLFAYCSRPVSINRLSWKGPFKFAGVVTGSSSAPPTSPALVTSPFTYQSGQKLFVRFRAIDGTGRLSSDQIDSYTVT